MRENWTYKKMSEVFDLQMGKTPDRKTPSYFGGNNVWVSIRDLVGKEIGESNEHITDTAVTTTNIRKVKKGTVIMSFKLTVGKCAITTKDLYTNEAIMAFNLKEGYDICPDYLYYYLSNYNWRGANKAVMGMTLNKATISQQKVGYPSLSEQQAIVSELDKINELISLKKAQLSDLDALAQSIFYDMFGDPIENEKGWEVKKLGEECVDMKYGTSSPACENGRYKYLRMGNITLDGHLDLSELKSIDISDNEAEKCIVKYGDILFNRTNSYELIGKTCMFDLLEPMVIAGYIIRVRLSNNLQPRYISKMFNLPSFKKLLRGKAKGAVNQANINSKELASIPIPLPPLALQQDFAKRVELIEQQKALISSTIKDLETLLASRMQYWFD